MDNTVHACTLTCQFSGGRGHPHVTPPPPLIPPSHWAVISWNPQSFGFLGMARILGALFGYWGPTPQGVALSPDPETRLYPPAGPRDYGRDMLHHGKPRYKHILFIFFFH